MALTAVTVTVDLTDAGSAAGKGYVKFTLSAPIVNGTTNIVPIPVVYQLPTSGTGTVVLYANDDAATTPAGTAYLVEVGLYPNVVDSYAIILHSASPTVNLAGYPKATTGSYTVDGGAP